MTVETTSFLASSKIANNGSEKSAKILKNNKNLVIFLLAAILIIFCLSASILQIWVFHRMNDMERRLDQMNDMQSEIKELRDNIRDIENNELEDREILKEISEFNRKYYNQNGIKDDIDMDESINSPDEKIKFDDVGDDEDDDDDEYGSENSEEPEDENYNGYHSGYGDDYDAEDEDYDSGEDEINDAPKTVDENNIYKDMEKHTRRARSIAGVTHQGVPIVDEPYALRRNRTKLSQNDANDPKLKLTWSGQQQHHRGNLRREHSERNRQHHNVRHHHTNQHSNRFAFAAAPVRHTFESYGQRFNYTPTTSTDQTPSIPIQSRQSRVMHFEDKTKAFRQVVGKDQLAKLQEQRMPPEHYVRNSAVMTARRPMRKNLELRNAKRMKITAVHFDGDSSRLEETSHYSYKGNKKVELNKDQYMHWKPADWVYSHGMAKYFNMDSSGTLTINDHGLFLIYAQVLYHDSHDLNGYVIEHNGDEHYKCITMTHTGTRGEKTNSCYTSGLIHLRNGDKIRLRDLANHRNVLMDRAKSYFGLIKINLIPSVPSSESSEIGRAVVK